MRAWPLALLAVAAPALSRDSLGVYEDWAAFRDPASRGAALRCYAIAEPRRSTMRGVYATVGHWPASRIRGQFHISLPAPATGAAILTIGDRRFILAAQQTGLWAADSRGDAAIVAAMRGGTTMRLAAGRISARWRLRGAATAIDAAALGCVR